MYVKTPHSPPFRASLGLFAYLKCWLPPCKMIVLSNEFLVRTPTSPTLETHCFEGGGGEGGQKCRKNDPPSFFVSEIMNFSFQF